jgi:hypothetical protein
MGICPAALKPALARTTTTAMRSPGSVDLHPVTWLPGSREAVTVGMTTDPATTAVHLHGPRAAVEITDTAPKVATERRELLPGNNLLPLLAVPQQPMDMVPTVPTLLRPPLVWELLALLRA